MAAQMDSTPALMQDLIYMLYQRLKSRYSSLEWDDLISNGRKASTRSFPALALAPECIRQEMHREIDESISAAREQHNASLTIHTLPPELLSNVLKEGLKNSRRSGRLVFMSLVCRHWNRVVSNTPALWTQWYETDEPKYLKRAQVQSKSLGLELAFNYVNDETWELLYKEVHRWQNVHLGSWRGSHRFLAKLQKLGKKTAPKLRKLSMDGILMPQLLDLFDPHDPCPLEELTLHGISVIWNAVNFERLRYLKLSKISIMAPSAAQLLQILEQNRELEHLSLTEMELSADPAEPSGPSQAILLPQLSSLKLLCPDDNSDILLRAIRFPQCKAMDVCGIRVSGPESVSGVSHLVPVIRGAIEVAETELRVYDDEVEVSTSGRTSVRVGIEGDPEVVLRWLITTGSASFNTSPAVTLIFHSNFSYDFTTWIISTLGQLQGIVELHFLGRGLRDDYCNPLDCLDNLGDQIKQAFPRLRTLRCIIDTLSELESLRRVVFRRHQAASSQENAAILPLQEVGVRFRRGQSLERCWSANLDDIQDLISEGNLTVGNQRWRS